MESDRLAERSVGAIAATLPGAMGVFRDYGIDFGCGGDRPLRESAERNHIRLDDLLQRLNALDPAAETDHPVETAELVRFIVERYHQTGRRELPNLIRLAEKVELVHREHPQVPRGLAEVLLQLAEILETHMGKEEQILFPMMLGDAGAALDAPIQLMRREHDDVDEWMQKIVDLTNGFVPPDDACRSWQALCALARKFVRDHTEHVHLENNVLFPRFAHTDLHP